ncbi:ATP-binding protein [Streptomyces sp. BBFR102]|uniref:ATP-binding protein n=1 Tax=Streptomyces sp. BBFR102 TaxID=3448171 RepID=UPI003F535041
MEAELGALAVSGATALVGLIVSEGFERAKSGLTRFFRRRASGAGAEEELRSARSELAGARASGDREAEAGVTAGLRRRLEDVFREDADAAGELAELLSQFAPDTSRGFVNLVGGGVNHGLVLQGSPVHGGIHYHAAPPPSPGPGRPVRPSQVPVVMVPFSNRSEELAAWEARLGAAAGGSPRVSLDVLDGLPGVGKTAMAWRCAELAEGHFPDGHLYVDFAALRDQISPGADVSEALAMCLRALPGGDTGIPDTLAERTNLFRSRTSGLRILLVLDDVNQAAQVRALIPNGPGSAVLATSQRKFGELAVTGARLVSLKPLDAHGGLALLTDRCGARAVEAERAAALRLVELCGGLPVALQVVAARLITDAGLSMAELAAELDDEAGRLDALAMDGQESAVSVALEPSYRLLPPDAARLYRLLGWLPFATFDTGVAAVAAGLDARSAKRLLGVLAQASLVEAAGDGRYRMHDLVRLHAREHAAAEEPATARTALTERVSTHYLVLTAFADLALREERLRVADLGELLRGADDPFAAAGGPPPLEWLHTERTAVLAVLREAVRQELYPVAWRLAEAFTVFFLYHRYLRAWTEVLELGVEAAAAASARARTAGEVEEATAGEARLRALLSRPLLDLQENGRAGEQLERAVALADTTGRLVLRASVQEFLGRYLDIVDPARAPEAYRRSLALNESAGESRGAALATFFLGCALDARGDHEDAMALLLRARTELEDRAEPDRRMAARAKAAIGVAHGHLGDSARAIGFLREACAELAEVAAATDYEAQARVRLADVAARTADGHDLARESLHRAAEIYEARGSLHLAQEVRRRLEGLGG